MTSAAGVAIAGCLLLVVGGTAKLMRPASLARALTGVGIAGGAVTVRLVALAEIVIAVAAITFGGRAAWCTAAASYVAFAAFVVVVRRRGGALASCGCFGGAQTPATWTHVAVTAAYAAAMVGAALSPPAVLDASVGDAAGVAVVAAVVAYLSYAVLAVLPQVRAIRPAQG